MKKTIELNITKNDVAHACAKVAGGALDFGVGCLEGAFGGFAMLCALARFNNPIAKVLLASCTGVASAWLSCRLNAYVFENQPEFEDNVEEFVGNLIGADNVIEEKEKEAEFEKTIFVF